MANSAKIVEKDGVTSVVVNGAEITNVTSYNIRKDNFMNGEAEFTVTFKAGTLETAAE